MVFKKEKWLEQINLEIAQGIHTELEKEHNLTDWVNDLDGKEIEDNEQNAGMLRFCEEA